MGFAGSRPVEGRARTLEGLAVPVEDRARQADAGRSNIRGMLLPYRSQWAALLTTYRRDGTPVGTPVNVVVDGDRILFRTYRESGKAKRLLRDDRVELRRSSVRGTPFGPVIRGRARRLEGEEDRRAGEAIDRKYPFFQRRFVRLGHRLRGYRTVHFEVIPTDEVIPAGEILPTEEA